MPQTAKRLSGKIQQLVNEQIIDGSSKILFVDDGSGDNTWSLIEKYHAESPRYFSGIKLSRNRGHQNALLCGLLAVKDQVDAAIMFILYNIAGIGYWFSSAANYAVGSVLSFFLNKYFTFNVKHWSAFMIFTFIANIAICYGIAYGIAKPAMNYFLRDSSQKLRENAAMFTGMCLFTGINYLGQRLVVFRKEQLSDKETI